MDNDKLIEFVRRWRSLEREAGRLDYERSKLSAEIRAEFANGPNGDGQFIRWCEAELGLNQFKADEMLCRSRAFAVVEDEKTWVLVGGFKGIRIMLDLDPESQSKVLCAVRTTAKSPRTIMKEMGLVSAGNKIYHASPDERVFRLQSDAVALAEFISSALGNSAPDEIRSVVARYAVARRSRKAA